ncbi:hypothetical protein ANN_04500 [Periplaneta americana]|uniref:Tc1-like transposase DDE domain-containing protein n=1 Tax=Periplaneta americana TaxID=6978 RepID=A0ABQ8TA95_PERAM|nr:hypothetical protein ANN_04500 [Periplaneta americana]
MYGRMKTNPRGTVPSHHQVRFSLNMRASIIGDRLVGPHVLVNRLTGQAYTNFLEKTIPHVLEDTPLINRQHIHFLHDGASAHFSRTARRYLDRRFPDRWIGRGGPIAWPPRSPDLNPLDFYLGGHLKSLVYSSPVPGLESLRNRIVACSEDIRNTPGVWDRVRRSMRHRFLEYSQAEEYKQLISNDPIGRSQEASGLEISTAILQYLSYHSIFQKTFYPAIVAQDARTCKLVSKSETEVTGGQEGRKEARRTGNMCPGVELTDEGMYGLCLRVVSKMTPSQVPKEMIWYMSENCQNPGKQDYQFSVHSLLALASSSSSLFKCTARRTRDSRTASHSPAGHGHSYESLTQVHCTSNPGLPAAVHCTSNSGLPEAIHCTSNLGSPDAVHYTSNPSLPAAIHYTSNLGLPDAAHARRTCLLSKT